MKPRVSKSQRTASAREVPDPEVVKALSVAKAADAELLSALEVVDLEDNDSGADASDVDPFGELHAIVEGVDAHATSRAKVSLVPKLAPPPAPHTPSKASSPIIPKFPPVPDTIGPPQSRPASPDLVQC